VKRQQIIVTVFALGLSFALTWVVVAAGREAGPAGPDAGRATGPWHWKASRLHHRPAIRRERSSGTSPMKKQVSLGSPIFRLV
jgi:hypothetical protein